MREVFEAKNLARVVRELVGAGGPPQLSVETILRWHGVLLSNVQDDAAGRFRQEREWVRVGGHVGASPDVAGDWVRSLVEWFLGRSADRAGYAPTEPGWFLDRIARFHLEFGTVHPFVDGNGRIGRVIINQQLVGLGWPPVIVRNRGKTRDYYPLFDNYVVTDKFTGMTGLLALLLAESLHKRLTLLSGRPLVPLASWANRTNASGSSVANRAKRQTIPAFRLRDRWMIDAGFCGDAEAWLEQVESGARA